MSLTYNGKSVTRKDDLKKDTTRCVWVFKINAFDNNKFPDFECANVHVLSHLKAGNIYVSTWRLHDTLWFEQASSNVKKMSFPDQFSLSLLNNYPTWESGWYSQKGYSKPRFCRKHIDTIVFYQNNRQDSVSRFIYFNRFNQVVRVEYLYSGWDCPMSFLSFNFSYHSASKFDDLMQKDHLYKFTPKASQNTLTQRAVCLDSIDCQMYGDTSFICVSKKSFYLFDYWYIGCYPCRKMMPFMNQIFLRSDTSKIKFIGVNTFDSEAKINYLKTKLNFDISQLNTSIFAPPFTVNLYPTIILTDAHKNIIKKWEGYSPSIIEDIQAYLKTNALIR